MSPTKFILDRKNAETGGNAAVAPRIKPPETRKIYDLMILGAGPAGMTAAVYASRKMLDTLIVAENIGGQPLLTSKIENYMGYQYITGKDLAAKFDEQMKKFPLSVDEKNEASSIKNVAGGFSADTKSGDVYSAKAVIIATGKRSRELGVPGERKLLGKGVAYCSVCDAPLFAGKTVAVVGGGNSALTAAVDFLKIAGKIYLINDKPELAGDEVLRRKIESPAVEKLMSHTVTEIFGDTSVEGLAVKPPDGKIRRLAVQGVFIEIGLVPNSGFVRGFLATNSQNEIIVDCRSHTSVEGVFAAGDVTSVPEKQIIVAAGEGAKAALAAYRYIIGLEKNRP